MDTSQDYHKGLLFFCGLMVCILCFFTAPDGVSLFYKLLGLFGISPGIPVGENSTLYIFMLIPLVAGIYCFKKVRKLWQGYIRLRSLPVVIAIALFLSSNHAITPSVIDRIYFSVIAQQSGLRTITVFTYDTQLSFEFTGNERTYQYGIMLNNHGRETQSLNIKLIYRDIHGFQEVYIKDESGNIKTFVLPPRQSSRFFGNFTSYQSTIDGQGGGHSFFTVVLVNEYEQHSPNFLVRRPIMS